MSYNSTNRFGPPNLVTNGLILYLDAANTDSYPGSGNIWYDLQYKQEITLFNSPTFNNSGIKNFQFNGTNQYASGSLSPGLAGLPYTVSSWMYCDSIPASSFSYWLSLDSFFLFAVSDQYSPAAFYFALANPIVLVTYAFFAGLNNGSILDYWFNVTAVCNPSVSNKIYLNGILASSNTDASTGPILPISNKLEIGKGFALPSNFFSGSISTVSIYNRALSDQEVAQNYNALKTRFPQ
jgi:hypothetical protein